MEMKKIGLIVALSAAVLCGCKRNAQMPDVGQYKTMVVDTCSRTLQTTAAATIRGKQDIEIYPQVSGKITSVKVTEGQNVRRGQVLFTIDRVQYDAAYRTAEANRQAAQVSVEGAQLTLNSKQSLYDSKVISEYELKTAQNGLLSAKASLSQAVAQKVNAANNLSYTNVTSPCDGVVGSLPYRVGALVSSAMSQPMTTVSDNSEMFVYFSIDENTLLDYNRRYGTLENAIKQMPDIELQLSDGTTYDQKGRIESISGVINRSTGTAQARAVFPNPKKTLLSGASGSVLIPHTFDKVIIIPQQATFELQDKVLVYKIVEGQTKSQIITVSSISDGKEYIVTDGLNVGDEIIAEGAGLLREGVKVGK